tara:strand:- start:185 stop:772 length:588 start_codon:yes stop_codon:yes gene_type:complete
MEILDLGCGTNKVENAIGMDNVLLPTVDIVHDLLDFPYPIEEHSIDIIYLRHVIEHFNNNNVNLIMNECQRIIKENGNLIITVPHVFSISAFTDVTHKSFYTFGSGNYWDKNHSKSYYKDFNSQWILTNTQSKVTWFDWKKYRLKPIDKFISSIMKRKIEKALLNSSNPSLADRIVKRFSFQFIEIKWTYKKESI